MDEGAPAGRVCITVANTRPGIPDGILEKVFDPFYLASGHVEEALTLFREAVDLEPGAVGLTRASAETLLAAGRPAETEAAYAKVL